MKLGVTACTLNTKEYDLKVGEKDTDLGAQVFHWKNVHHISKLPHGSNYKLSFYVEPKFHWKDIVINDSVIDFYMNACSHTEVIKIAEGWITFTYRAQKKYVAEYNGNMIELVILSVVLGVYEYTSFLDSFCMRESHQIFAVIKLEKGHTVVLGRAQSVETTEYGGTRTYKWIVAKDDTVAFKGVPRRNSMNSHIEDLYIMDQLKQGPLLSARPKREYEADNDMYENKNPVLPIIVPSDQSGSLVIQFFNAKYKPAPFVETSVRWSTIFGKCSPRNALGLRRKSSSKQLFYKHVERIDEYLSYMLNFTCTANGLSMIEVTFVAKEYHFSLDSLGKNIKLNSV